MTITQWFIFFLVVQLIHFAGTWKLYLKAGRKAWEAAVPVYNAVVLMKIINRPTWWVILLFIPVVNLIMFPVVWVETLRSFGKNKPVDTILGVLTLGLYIYYINYTQDVQHLADRSTKPKTESGETVSSILFAVVVATIIHTYFIQPFTIPTSSLEKTLLVGDFLFVSKMNYGARTPQTAVALPMVHDTIPFTKVKSYTTFPQLPAFRFPGFQEPKHNDIVVFNWPADTVPYFGYSGPLRYDKPVDKKSNYVKRLVGMPGDNLSIKDGVVYIDDQVLDLGDRAKVQYTYDINTNGNNNELGALIQENNITEYGVDTNNPSRIFMTLTDDLYQKIKGLSSVISIEKNVRTAPEYKAKKLANGSVVNTEHLGIFPHNQEEWTGDNLGPIHIPAKGEIVDLTIENLPFYQAIITDYENNTLEVKNGEIIINGKATTKYTIQQNYFYMMGDNRHNSEDSRYWGFVPENHIVGKPLMVWMSLDPNVPWSKAFDKIRWDRTFTTVHGSGKPRSFLFVVVIAIAGWIVYGFIQRRKKKKSAYKV